MEGQEVEAQQVEALKLDSGCTERLERLHGFEVSCAAKVRCRLLVSYLRMLVGLV